MSIKEGPPSILLWSWRRVLVVLLALLVIIVYAFLNAQPNNPGPRSLTVKVEKPTICPLQKAYIFQLDLTTEGGAHNYSWSNTVPQQGVQDLNTTFNSSTQFSVTVPYGTRLDGVASVSDLFNHSTRTAWSVVSPPAPKALPPPPPKKDRVHGCWPT